MVIRRERPGSNSSTEAAVIRRPKAKRLNSERKFVVLSDDDNPMLASARTDTRQTSSLLELLDSFTSMCACDQVEASSSGRKPRMVYPVERFPDYPALNSQMLVQQRRQEFGHQTFRPVSFDERSYR